MKFLLLVLIGLSTCQFIEKNKEPLPVIKCLLTSEKLMSDIKKAVNAVQKYVEDKDLVSLLLTAMEVVPDAYNEVMKCLNEDVILQKLRLNPKKGIKKLKKKLKKFVEKIPKPVIEQGKKLLKEKGVALAKDFCKAKIKVKELCDNIDLLKEL